MKKSGIGQSGLPVITIMLAGGLLLTGFMGCSDNGTTVKVETTPSAAKVFIDGKFVGLSPCECFIRDSQPDDLWEQHTVEVKAKGFEPQSRRLRYRTGAAWLPDKIDFVMAPSAMLDEADTPQPEAKSVVKSKTPAPAPKREVVYKPVPKPEKEVRHKLTLAPAPKETYYKPVVAARRKDFKSTTPWSKAAPINDDNIPPAPTPEPAKTPEPAQPPKKDIAARHAEMEKIVVTAKGTTTITAPKLPEIEPDDKERGEEPVIAAAPKKSPVETPAVITEERPQPAVPVTRSRLAPLPKQIAKTEKSAKPQFIGSVPWRNISSANRQQEIELISGPIKRHITATSARAPKADVSGKAHSPAAPWIEAGGLSVAEDTRPEEPRPIHAPEDDRLFSCDLRIARVSDGVVLRQASGVDTYANLQELADDLVSELAAYVPDNATVAIFCFHNRRNTESGRFIADKMLEAVVDMIRKSNSLTYVKTVNIRDALNNEISLEQSKQLTKPRFYPLLKNAEYVIIGGVALFDNFAKVATRPAGENQNNED